MRSKSDLFSLRGAAVLCAIAASGCASAPRMVDTHAVNACAVPAAVTAEDAIVRLPFDIVHGRVYVDARVNGGGPYRFAIDTGAGGLGRADASLTNALSLPVVGREQTSDGVNTATVETVRINSLELGGMMIRDIDVITRDYSSSAPPGAAISGIIGRDFFADGLLVIDFPSRTLTFTRSHGLSSGDEGALAYERPFRVPVTIGDQTVEGNLDTGASVTMVFPRALYDQVRAGPLEAAGQGQLTNTVIDSSRTVVHGPVRVGGASVSDVEVRVSDRFPELLVGGQVLQSYIIAIDQRTRLVAICQPNG